jgi:uncharacterized protein YkwD
MFSFATQRKTLFAFAFVSMSVAGCAAETTPATDDVEVGSPVTSVDPEAVDKSGRSLTCGQSLTNEQSTIAAEILRLVNIERTNRGMRPFTGDACLANVATGYSKTMSRTSACLDASAGCNHDLDGSVQSRLDRANLGYTNYGENIYTAWPVTDAYAYARGAVTWWMNSPGHRANILGNFTHLGVGVTRAGDHVYAVQDFASFSGAQNPPSTPPSSGQGNGVAIAFALQSRSWARWYGGGQANAEQRALSSCRSRDASCQNAVSRPSGCVAVWAGTNGWGSGAGSSLAEANQYAQQWCQKYASNCTAVTALCADGSGS